MSDDGWNRNEIALRVDPVIFDAARVFDDLMRQALRRQSFPWEFPDRNPMPRFDWWPLIDRAIWWRAEAPKRLRGALDVLRYGEQDREDW